MSQTQETFTPKSVTIRQLFNDADALYQIPRYQRPYKWADDEIDKLWSDLMEAYENGIQNYFLGSVITAAPQDNSSYRDVVDGQQRMTTLIIMFAVVRDLFPSLNKTSSPEPSLITNRQLRNSIIVDDEFNRLKLNTHVQHYTDFESLIVKGDTSHIKKPFKKEILKDEEPKFKFLNTAYILREKFNALGEEITSGFINYIFNHVMLIRIDCSDKQFAIKLFQVLNDRGLDLTNADLIKSFLLQKLLEKYGSNQELVKQKEDLFIQEWIYIENISKEFDDNINDLFIVYEYYLLGTNPKKSLYDELTKLFDQRDPLEIISEFKSFVLNYKNCLDSTSKDIYALRYLRWSVYWKAVVLAAYQVNYPEKDALITLLKKYYYTYWVAGKTLTAVKQTSFNLIGMVKSKTSFETIAEAIHTKMEADKIIDDLIKNLKDDIYGLPWCKPLFCLIEYASTDSKNNHFIELNKELHLEHIIPQDFSKYPEWSHISSDIFTKIGNSCSNLTLLSGSKNSEASNNPFETKISIYNGKGKYNDKDTQITEFQITQMIVNDYNSGIYNKQWNQDAIKARQTWFYSKIEKVLGVKIPVE